MPILTNKEAKEQIPPDILPLYTSIRSVAMYHQAFVPAEIRSEIEDELGEDVPGYWFRAPNTMAYGGNPDIARQDAILDFKILQSLQAAASKSKALRRYEDAWNAEVYLPLLKLAFSSRPGSIASGQEPVIPEVIAELVTSATIDGDSVPRLRKRNSTGCVLQRTGSMSDDGTFGSIPACFISFDDNTSASSPGSFWETPPTAADRVQQHLQAYSHSKQGSKKVDLALLFVPPPGLDAAIS